MNKVMDCFRSCNPFQWPEEVSFSYEGVLETISDAYAAVRDTLVEYNSKMPSLMTGDVAFITVALNAAINGEVSLLQFGSPYTNPDYLAFSYDLAAVTSVFVDAAMRNVTFALLLTIVNAVIRPLFKEHFPKDWGFTQLILEITITLAIVAIPLYFYAGMIGLENYQLVQMVATSAFCRLVTGYRYNFEAEKMIAESKLNSYEMEATPWFAISTSMPIF